MQVHNTNVRKRNVEARGYSALPFDKKGQREMIG